MRTFIILFLSISGVTHSSPAEFIIQAIPSITESMQSIGEIRLCLSEEMPENQTSDFCKLGGSSDRASRNRDIQNMCNNQRAQNNTRAQLAAFEEVDREISSNISNPKHDIEESIRFLNSSPDAFNAFTIPTSPPEKPDYNFGLFNPGEIISVLNTAKNFRPKSSERNQLIESCKSNFFMISATLSNAFCMESPPDETFTPFQVQFYSSRDEIDRACPYRPPETNSIECSSNIEDRSNREFDFCMREPTIGRYTYTDFDYYICNHALSSSSPSSIERCKESIDRQREAERLRERAQKEIRCQQRKERFYAKCKRSQQRVEERNEARRIEREQCVTTMRQELQAKATQQRERRIQEETRNRKEKERQCIKRSLKNLFCESSSIDFLPECAETNLLPDTETKKCARLILTSLYRINKQNFTLNDGNSEEEIVENCRQNQGLSQSNCEALLNESRSESESISAIYTADRMMKAQTKFDETKSSFSEMLESWKNEGRISEEKFSTLIERLNKTELTPPKSKTDLIRNHNSVATCACHKDETSQDDHKSCSKNTITLGPEIMLSLDHGNIAESLTAILAHELGHALAPDMTSTENIFNNVYQCLSQKVSADQHIHDDPKTQRRFAKETMADWFSSEFMAYRVQQDPPSSDTAQFSLETTFCSRFLISRVQNDSCLYREGQFLYPKEMDQQCLGDNTASTYPIFPDRLAIFTENPRLRESMGCPVNPETSIQSRSETTNCEL